MPERVCECGNKLSSMNRSLKCYRCKEEARKIKQATKRVNILEEMKAAGRVRVHSCISHLLDPAPLKCSCRKFVSFEEAKRYIEIGRCLDWKTRKPMFSGNAIVERSRQKCPPLSTLGARIAIERSIVRDRIPVNEAAIARMKRSVAEDKAWRNIESDLKIDIEHEIALEEQNKLIKFYTPDEWADIEQTFSLHRGFYDGIGTDDRTLGGVGRNHRLQDAVSDDDSYEFATAEREDSQGIKSKPIDDEPNIDPTNVVSFESLECLQAEIEDTEEMAA
jgi:hypothetical protein